MAERPRFKLQFGPPNRVCCYPLGEMCASQHANLKIDRKLRPDKHFRYNSSYGMASIKLVVLSMPNQGGLRRLAGDFRRQSIDRLF